ncbi:YraN family protein [Paenibacillus sp. GbtcB18]|uniref:YraN family protein n=1 Tax=Paenibacillus sp. GbtcB18 TaxID=2824763 RepID=UPI001C311780|nr:YraN family protein [Paenibacillus sp. GbtcB18]
MAFSPLSRKDLGRYGEQRAEEHIAALGYKVVARNWRCRSGEIDLIAETEDRLVFIEVRTRRLTGRFGTAKESVDARKQLKVRQIAQMYLYAAKQSDRRTRFDVITVELTPEGEFNRLEHLTGAF